MSETYSNPRCVTHVLSQLTISTNGTTYPFQLQKGKVGILRDVVYNFSSSLTNGTSTGPTCQVGKSGTLGAYASFTVAAASANITAPDSVRASETSGAITGTLIDADTQILITLTAPTGGSPSAGVATIDLFFDTW